MNRQLIQVRSLRPALNGLRYLPRGRYKTAVPSLTASPSSAESGIGWRSGGLQLDEVASVAAARALELRENNEKGSRARKKAALTDLLRTLAAVGVSKLRSAVPVSERTVQAWFRQV